MNAPLNVIEMPAGAPVETAGPSVPNERKLTINLPPRYMLALETLAATYDSRASDYLETLIKTSALSPVGVVLKLELPPVKSAPVGELPLFA
jgi:hypothetical protein